MTREDGGRSPAQPEANGALAERIQELEAELRDLGARYAALVDDLPYAHFIADLTGTVTTTNRAAEEMTGYTAADRPSFMDLIVPEDLPRAAADLALVATEPNAGPREYRFRRKDGAIRDVEINTVALRQGDTLVGFQGTARDITHQKHVDRELAESEQRFRELADFLPGIVYEYDLTGRVTYANRHARQVTGYTEQDIAAGLGVLDLLAPEDRERAGAVMLRLLAGEGPARHEYHFVRKGGERVPVEVHGAPIHRGGEVVGVRGLAHDLTEIRKAEATQRNLERQLQRAQKLESLGILAGGVAHDFNNLLQVILGNVALAVASTDAESPLRPRLDAIRRAARHASDLSGQMLAYSGNTPVMAGPIDLNDAVTEMLDLLTAAIPKAVTLALELAEEPLWVEADRTQIQQVLVNLVTNAAESLGTESGTVTLRTRKTTATTEELASTPIDDSLAPGPYAQLTVSDTGCGMDERTLLRVFDPFFTTKFTGRGLGLAAAFGIVRAHRGAMQAESAPAEGTTFRVLLPAVEPPRPVASAHAASAAAPARGGRILLVDDERDVLDSTGLLLQAAGYEVLTAPDGHSALKTFEAHQDVDTVILDLSMPGLDGLATFRELRRRDPRLPIVLCSGYSHQDVADRFRGLSVDAFLKKPYELDDLLDTLRGLDERA